VDKAEAAGDADTGFTLDESLLARRKAANARRLYTVQIPAIRAAGFVILCVIALLQGLRGTAPFPQAELLALLALNLAYATLAWLVLRLGHGRSRRLDLSLLLFHVDVLVWLPNLHFMEQGQLFFAYFLLVRVVDQAGNGFRRALYFNHVIVLAYLGYSVWVSLAEPGMARWTERLGIAAIMYLLGLYLASTGVVAERLRRRSRDAVRAARALVERLDQEARTLHAQAVELEAARRQAEQASLAKSQVLAVTSHEFRTPMNGILGAAELLMGTPLTPVQEHYVRTAHRSAHALLTLIDDVLDLSRIEAGKLTLRDDDVDLRALVDEVVDLVAVTAGDKPLVLSCTVTPPVPRRVRVDPSRLRQLLVNLLHNAVKFTDRGTVELAVSVRGGTPARPQLRFQVRDTGIGIADDQLNSIFDAFAQVDASSTRRHGGSGLGLAIVRDLARLMGGEVGVESRLGAGSTFWIDLPLVTAADPPAAAAAEASRGSDDAGAAQDAVALLAEDDPVNRMVGQEMLKMLGCEVDVVDDGAAACAAVAARRYDIVFMDCHMPVMDGFEATRRIRQAEGGVGRRLPIVALTADALAGDRDRCLHAGMDDFLTKPASSGQLAAMIERWTGRRTLSPTQW
jgi:signal transduction histidine kinase/CheY-like chemotaxis protein